MVGVVYFILSLDDPDRPGKIADYVPLWDFEIDIRRGGTEIDVAMTLCALACSSERTELVIYGCRDCDCLQIDMV